MRLDVFYCIASILLLLFAMYFFMTGCLVLMYLLDSLSEECMVVFISICLILIIGFFVDHALRKVNSSLVEEIRRMF